MQEKHKHGAINSTTQNHSTNTQPKADIDAGKIIGSHCQIICGLMYVERRTLRAFNIN